MKFVTGGRFMGTGKVAIVMGTGGPIDAALARAFAQEQISTELIEHKTSKPIVSDQWRTTTIDITNEGDVRQAIQAIAKKRQKVDYLVTCPDLRLQVAATDLADPQWEDSTSINLTSIFLICKHALPVMIKQRFGRIVNVTSVAAHTGAFRGAAYSAAKAATLGFSKALAREVADYGITVNLVSAGLVGDGSLPFRQDSEGTSIPLGRFGRWEEVVEMVVLLVSDRVSYVTGQTIHVNGGLFMP